MFGPPYTSASTDFRSGEDICALVEQRSGLVLSATDLMLNLSEAPAALRTTEVDVMHDGVNMLWIIGMVIAKVIPGLEGMRGMIS
jgi:hypothetical protein